MLAAKWISSPIYPCRSVTTGESGCTFIAKACLFRTLESHHLTYVLAQAAQWIDDLTMIVGG